MKPNIIIGIGLVLLAVILAYLSRKQVFGDGWLDKADKIASIMSLIVAIVAFINPFARNEVGSAQQATVGNNNGNITIGQSRTGDVTIGDTTTSAQQRADTALSRVKVELLANFRSLALLIKAIEDEPPREFWDKRRANETELSYQDRAAEGFRDYQKGIGLYLTQLRFSNNLFGSFQRELSYYPNFVGRVEQTYDEQNEVKNSFSRFETGLQHILSLQLSDVERNVRSQSLHWEMIANSKMAFAYAAAHFCMIANQEDMTILRDSFSSLGIVADLQPGKEGYQQAMRMAAKFANEREAVLRERLSGQSKALRKEVDRRINDPYLIMLRKAAGLSPTLTEAEVTAFRSKPLDSRERDPLKLFKLAAFSYLESDGNAATFYFRRAIETNQLSPLQKRFAQLSVHRLENPERYSKSIGIMVMKLTSGRFKKSGLAVGDVIVSIDGQVCNEPFDIASALAKVGGGPTLLGIMRNGRNMIVRVHGGEAAGAVLTQLVVFNVIQI
jgi:hypothetical protein